MAIALEQIPQKNSRAKKEGHAVPLDTSYN